MFIHILFSHKVYAVDRPSCGVGRIYATDAADIIPRLCSQLGYENGNWTIDGIVLRFQLCFILVKPHFTIVYSSPLFLEAACSSLLVNNMGWCSAQVAFWDKCSLLLVWLGKEAEETSSKYQDTRK